MSSTQARDCAAAPPGDLAGTSRPAGAIGRSHGPFALALFLACGALLTVLNLGWPVARNALAYAKAAQGLSLYHFQLSLIAHDPGWSGGKPLLFSLIAAPFVRVTNANTATIIASALCTAFFLWTVCLTLRRLNARNAADPVLEPLEFTLTAFNPLVLYQFWSGYPDSLFAGLVLLGYVLADVIATEPGRDTRWHIVGLGATICAAVYTKLYGLILVPLLGVYLLLHGPRLLRNSTHLVSKIALLGVTLAALVASLVTAKWGTNPMLSLSAGDGVDGYLSGLQAIHPQDLKDALIMLIVTLILAFQLALLFLLVPRAWRVVRLAPTVFIGLYIVGLFPFPGTGYNMRYFLPVLPFFSPLLAVGTRGVPLRFRRPILAGFVLIAGILTLNFNVAAVQRPLQPLTDKLYVWQPQLAGWLDNLRLPVQIALRGQIDAINAKVPPGGILYWSSDYYGTTTHGLAFELGVRRDIKVRYVLEPSFVSADGRAVFLAEFTSDSPPEILWDSPAWATVRSLGHGVFRLDPIAVDLDCLCGDYVEKGDAVRLHARVLGRGELRIGSLELLEGNRTIHSEQTSSLELKLPNPPPGRHELTARVTYGDTGIAVSPPLVVYVGAPALEREARGVDNLGTEYHDGTMTTAQTVLSLDPSEQVAAIRFEKIQIPRDARISRAYLKWVSASTETSVAEFAIGAELSADSPRISLRARDLSRRPFSASETRWRVAGWQAGESITTADLASLVGQVTGQRSWQPGNSVTLFIRTLTGSRSVWAIEGAGKGVPRLYIELER